MSILTGLIDSKIERILILFIENKGSLFHINKISKEAKVPLASSFRIVKKLSSLQIIEIVQVGKFKLYKLNKSKKIEQLIDLLR